MFQMHFDFWIVLVVRKLTDLGCDQCDRPEPQRDHSCKKIFFAAFGGSFEQNDLMIKGSFFTTRLASFALLSIFLIRLGMVWISSALELP